jgi:hypothetical protein
MVNVSGCGYDEVAVRKLARMKRDGSFVIEGGNRFSRAFDRAPERLIREIRGVEEFAEKLVRRVLDHLHLFENDFLLTFEIFLFKTRVGNKVGEQFRGLRQGGVRNLCSESRHLMRRIRVKVTPQPIRFYGNITRTSVPSAFENSMFDEVADAVELGSFMPGTAANPDSCGNRPEAGHVLAQDGNAVRKSRRLNIVDHLPGTEISWKPKIKDKRAPRLIRGPES